MYEIHFGIVGATSNKKESTSQFEISIIPAKTKISIYANNASIIVLGWDEIRKWSKEYMACVYLDFFDRQGYKYPIHRISSMEIYPATMEILMNWIVRRKYNISDIEVNIDYPEPFFVDRTNDIRKWLAMIDTVSLLQIGEACIKFLLLNVLCPYEYFSFIQRYRTICLITTAPAYLRTFALFAYCRIYS